MVKEQTSRNKLRELSWRFHALAVLGIYVIGALVYSNTLQAPFVADDTPNIVENHRTQLTQLKVENFYSIIFENMSPRPVAHLSFSLNYYFGEFEVSGYHLVNIAIHLFNGVVVYFLALNTFSLLFSRVSPQRRVQDSNTLGWLSLFSALLFLVHPVQTQAVTYLVQRMTSLATLFYLLSLWLYIQGRLATRSNWKWGFWIACIVSGILSLGTKQIAATLPLAIMLYEWYFFQDLNWDWAKRRLKVLVGLVAVVGLVALLFLGESPWQQILEGYERRDFTLGERVLTQFRVLVFYLSLLVLPLPSRMNLLHQISTSQGPLEPISTLFSLLLLIGLFGVAVYYARSQRLLSFAIVWMFLHLAIESSVIALEMIFEHRLYLPMFGAAMYVPYLIFCLFESRVVVARTLVALMLVCLSVGTYSRNATWRDEVTLWTDVISKNPVATRAYLARADAFGVAGDHEEALTDYAKAIELDPEYPNTFLNRGKYHLLLGQDRQALKDISQAIALDADFQRAYMSRGEIYARQRKLDLAAEDYTRAIELAPELASSYNNRGLVYGRQGKNEMALADFAQAIVNNPNFGQTYFNRGSFYRNLGEFEKSVVDYSQAIKLEPDVAGAYLGRGSVYESLGQDAKAIADYTRAIELGANTVPANKRLAWLLAASGEEKNRDGAKAIEYATKACGLADWKAPNCLEALAAAYAEQGEFSSATKWQSKAIELAGERLQPAMTERLELYRRNKAYRLPSRAVQ